MYFPIFLDLRGKAVLVIGNHKETVKRVETLITAGAKVTVLAKTPSAALVTLQKKKIIKLIRNEKYESVIESQFLVIVCGGERKVNEKIAHLCFEQERLVNVLDDPELCNYIFPSTFREGPLQVAVSTGGASPALAKHIRKKIQREWGKSWGSFLKFAQENRAKVMKTVRDEKLRKKIFENAGSKKIVSMLNSGKVQSAKKEFKKHYEKLTGKGASKK